MSLDWTGKTRLVNSSMTLADCFSAIQSDKIYALLKIDVSYQKSPFQLYKDFACFL